MKCLSLWQPWGTLMDIGAKRNETRSWYLKHRGPMAIHAAQAWGWKFFQLCINGSFYRVLSPLFPAVQPVLGGACPRPLPLGGILCVVNVLDCVLITTDNAPLAGSLEHDFGDYGPGRFMIQTEPLFHFTKPIPFPGRQGLFDVPDSLLTDHGYTSASGLGHSATNPPQSEGPDAEMALFAGVVQR